MGLAVLQFMWGSRNGVETPEPIKRRMIGVPRSSRRSPVLSYIDRPVPLILSVVTPLGTSPQALEYSQFKSDEG